MEKPENRYAREKTENMQELEWPLGNNKKISEVLYKIEHNSLPGVVVHGDNFIIQREKKINWFNGEF